MTIEELVDTLYATFRALPSYRNEFDLPHVEFCYHPKTGWEVFVTHDGERATCSELFYKVFRSPEDGLLENIAYFEQFRKVK